MFYYDRSPVADQVTNITMDTRSYTDSDGETWNEYTFHDSKIYSFMNDMFDSIRAYPSPQSNIRSPRNISDQTVTINSKDQQCTQAANQYRDSVNNTTQGSQKPVFNTVRDGYGDVANKDSVDDLVNNTGAYGGGTASLVYPSDLLTNTYGYNGCYTVLFISEHQQSTISQLKGFTTDKKYAGNNVAGSDAANTLQGMVTDGQSNPANGGGTTPDQVMTGAIAPVAGTSIGTSVAGSTILKTFASSAIKGPMGALFGSLAALGAGVSGGIGASYIANEFKITQNNTQFKQLNIAIALPTPALTDVHVLQWKDQSMALTGGIMQLAKSAGVQNINLNRLFSRDALDEIQRAYSLQQARGESLAKNAAAAGEAAALMVSKLGIGTALSVVSGKSANPRIEMVFDKVGYRTFEMNFQLGARSAKDMENIESIIRVLKYHAYPELQTGNFLWLYPAHFDIVHYYRNDVNTHMPRHATSVLTNISVDYGGGQNFISVHHDGSPVLINLKLTFQEIAILSRKDIANGY